MELNCKKSVKDGRFVPRHDDDDDGLTKKQNLFIESYVSNGADSIKASKEAGITRQSGYRMLSLPHVRQEIQSQIDKELKTEGASIAWGCIRGLIQDTNTPSNIRLNASKWVLEHSGFGLAGATLRMGLQAWTKPLTELSEAELEGVISDGKSAIEIIELSVLQTDKATDQIPDKKSDNEVV